MRLRRLVARKRVMDQGSEKLAVSVTVVAPEHARDSTVESDDVSGCETDDRIDNRGGSSGSGKSSNPGALPPSVPTASGTETTDPLVATRVTGATADADAPIGLNPTSMPPLGATRLPRFDSPKRDVDC
jgi:hypothetical protein